MGVPKFFRWMSERYPAISQLIAENRIPEFDALYLDMNGIIHNCTHNDSDSPTFRMTEDKMFLAIFNYIEHLFSKIKPKQLFFMAVDGVAPRAKMNQQRARRFRSALDAENAREKAIREGVEMPKEDAFDSNCITPGTEFMAKLTEHLKYFVNKKVSEDSDWQGVEIVLSGHEVPGEGEHKIMEYIRQAKAQPNYDPNMRHCLYGLDADLIMLGLLSHDPHFCLLREEVKFGRQTKEKKKELEHQNFFLMHLCMVREYLELEFQELKEPGRLSFPFDMERVIDDFILMAFFVGNDFLPNLPHLHINEGALALMFNVYKTVLPKAKGYINEGGVINLQRLEVLLDELSHVEFRFFESENSDASWLKGKKGKEDVMERTKRRGKVVMTTPQKEIYAKIKQYVTRRSPNSSLDLSPALPAGDRKFVQDLADDLHLEWKSVENEYGERYLQLGFPSRPGSDEDDEDDEDEDEDDEAQSAVLRVLKRYNNATIEDVSADEAQAAMEKQYEQKFQKWKDQHYTSKFGWGLENEAELTQLTENYVQGLQWVLFYYYQGIASWPWYFRYHYAPMISDVKKGLKADMNFKLGQPFLPYQQLMGVLPDRSKKIVPTAYWELMTSKDSPIIDFYPRDFELDMNGKKADWEAVVKIPFIDEDRLLSAMATKDQLLTPEERSRNKYGVTLSFTYDPSVEYAYPSSLQGVFPDLQRCHCVENEFELPTMEGLHYRHGLMDGVLLGASALAGFPSLKVLPFHAQLGFHGVNVFQQDSRNESMVVTLTETEMRTKVAVAQAKIGKAVHVGFPFLQEAKIVKVSDELFDYILPPGSNQVVPVPHEARGISDFKRKADRIEEFYSKRLAMVVGTVESLVHVEMLKGLKRTDEGATVKDYGDIPGIETEYATQMIVDEVISIDQRFIEKEAVPIEEEFPIDSKHFFVGEFAYGRPLSIVAHRGGDKLDAYVLAIAREPEFGREIVQRAERSNQWIPSFAVAKQLQLNPLVLSKLTSSFSVNSSGLRLNLGLNLKFEGKKLKVLGYSRKGQTGWEYSPKAINLIQQYMLNFPEFIAGIAMKPRGDIYDDTDFYPPETAKQKVKEITAWLKENNARGFEKVPLDADQLDSDVVKQIEEAADHLLANGPKPEAKKISNVPRNAILNPADADQRINHQKFALGDRIVYVLNKGKVPIGQRGTVIGITRTYRTDFLDVVFDVPIMSGSSLGERCSPFRGATVPADSVLNLTNKQVIALSKASAEKRPTHSPQPFTIQSHGGTGVNLAYNAKDLQPAAAPPPLTGSFKGALSGLGNGHGQNLPVRTRGGGSAFAGQTNGHNQNGHSRGRGRGGVHLNGQQTQHAQIQQQQPQQQPGSQNPRGGNNSRGRGRGGENAGRGRGGAQGNRDGYTITDMSDPTEGVIQNNPNFKPKNYQNVPPPASLDSSSTRGRGRGRGRGGSNRGRGRGATPQQT